MVETKEDGVSRGLRSSPCLYGERHWSPLQRVMLGELADSRKGICAVDRAVWQDAQEASCASQGRHRSLRFHLPGVGEVTPEALVAYPTGGS